MATAPSTQDVPLQDTALPTPPKISKKTLIQRIWEARISYFMLLAFFIPFIMFIILPMVASAYLAMTDYSGARTQEIEFVGLENFRELLSFELEQVDRRVDAETGEIMFRCGRRYATETEAAAYTADGTACTPAYVDEDEVLSDGYDTVGTFFRSDHGAYIFGAQDHRFWKAISNTTIYTIFSVAFSVIIGLGLALALQAQSVLNMILRTVFFLPSVTAGVAITVVWGHLFRGTAHGLINSVITGLGREPIEFLANADWTLPIVIMLAVWGGAGYNMILFLAGLGNIPEELYEAATVDGASTTEKFRFITLPLLRPMTLFIVITGIIGSFQVFDAVYILFANNNGGVGHISDSALTIVSYLYERGFTNFEMGYASAMAWVLFIIIFILTFINLRVGRANEAH